MYRTTAFCGSKIRPLLDGSQSLLCPDCRSMDISSEVPSFLQNLVSVYHLPVMTVNRSYPELPALTEKFFFADIYKDDIRSYLTDTLKRDHIFTVISEQTTESPRPRHNNRLHAPFLHIHYEIYHTAKSPAVPCVDDFFFSQIAKSHPSSLLSPRP